MRPDAAPQRRIEFYGGVLTPPGAAGYLTAIGILR